MSTPVPPGHRLSQYGRDLLRQQYDHVEQQAALATTKASLLVTAQSIIAATYVSLAKDCSVFTSLGTSPAGCVFGAAGVLILVGLLAALVAIYPRIANVNRGVGPPDVLYFGSVVERWRGSMDVAAFAQAFRRCDEDDTLEHVLFMNIHGKSEWLLKNFKWVQVSLWTSGIGTVAAVVAIFVLGGIMRIMCTK